MAVVPTSVVDTLLPLTHTPSPALCKRGHESASVQFVTGHPSVETVYTVAVPAAVAVADATAVATTAGHDCARTHCTTATTRMVQKIQTRATMDKSEYAQQIYNVWTMKDSDPHLKIRG